MADTLDIENAASLVAYLRATAHIEPSEEPQLTILSGGVSNRAVLLRRPSGESWVLKQALPRLRVSVEWLSDPRRIEREALGMQRLGELAPGGRIPSLLFVDPKHHLLAMSAVPQPHENWKSMLLAGLIDSDHVTQFSQLLGTIHRAGWERRDVLAKEFDDRTFFESLRVEPYYLYSSERMPAVVDFYHDLVARTRASRLTLVHGDYSPKNILVHDDRLILLDHEVIHFGDPAFDVGFSLAHLLSKANWLADRRADFAAAARSHWRLYRQSLGSVSWAAELEARSVAHTLGCLLARCIGRSPLEYLTPEVAARQANASSAMMLGPACPDLNATIDEFVSRLSR